MSNQISNRRTKTQPHEHAPTSPETKHVFQQLQSITSRLKLKKGEVSVQTKHATLSAIACVDVKGGSCNQNMTKGAHPKIGKKLLKYIASIKHKFNASNTVLSFNARTYVSNGVDIVHEDHVEEDTFKFWIDDTTPDPNIYKYGRLKDENEMLDEQHHHFPHCKHEDFCHKWIHDNA